MGAPVAAKDKKRGGGGQKGGRGGKRGRGGAPFRGGMMRGGGRGGMRGGMLPPMMPPMRGGRGPMRGRMRGGMPPPMMMGPPMHPMYPHPGMMPPPHMMYGPPMPPPMHFRGGPRGKGGRFQQNFRGGVNAKGKIVKKRNGKANHKKPMDVTKPFVTDEIKAEFTLKDELLTKAKASQDKDDWVKFREQRDKCSTIYLAAEKEFKGQQEAKNSEAETNKNLQSNDSQPTENITESANKEVEST